MTKLEKPINVKLDAETKSKIETLAFLERESLQTLCYNLIKDAIDNNADRIAEAENLRKNSE